MNERIRELAEQAGVDAGQTIANTICGDDEWVALGNEFNKLSQKTRDLIYKTLEQNQEKFAELIVRECLAHGKLAQSQAVVNGSEEYNAGREMGIEVFMNQIKKHFGVEE